MIPSTHSPILWCDNLSAICLKVNPILHAHTKHVEIDVHFLCEKVHAKCFRIQHILSSEQPTEILTKPHTLPPFLHNRLKFSVQQVPLSLREGNEALPSFVLSSSIGIVAKEACDSSFCKSYKESVEQCKFGNNSSVLCKSWIYGHNYKNRGLSEKNYRLLPMILVF